jgi:hypothetical protein
MKFCGLIGALERAGFAQPQLAGLASAQHQNEGIMENKYVGFNNDKHGMTQLGRIVLDGWLFGFIPESEDCAGWDMGRMQALMDRVEKEWDKYGTLPSRLPAELRQRHAELYAKAMDLARGKGWNPELGEDD